MTQDTRLTTNDQRPKVKSQRPTANGQRPDSNVPSRRSERGYILLMLMLFVTLMVIAAGVAAPTIAFRVRRDREEEMIHRGTQYSRAIQRYVKKTGRYPCSPRRPGKYQQHSLPSAALQGPRHRQGFQIAARGRSPTDQLAGHSRSQFDRGPGGPGWWSGASGSGQHHARRSRRLRPGPVRPR